MCLDPSAEYEGCCSPEHNTESCMTCDFLVFIRSIARHAYVLSVCLSRISAEIVLSPISGQGTIISAMYTTHVEVTRFSCN